jgi:hypothetical protein
MRNSASIRAASAIVALLITFLITVLTCASPSGLVA